jgi:predicted NBD/HSP70 family sugar kinase
MVCEGIGVSLPGRINHTGRLVFAPNLGWRDVDIREMLEAATGLPVNVENAANACALGELWFGQHDEHVRHLVAVTVSEGIGVGVLLNGQLIHGANAMAGEFGHMTFDESGPPCCCGKRGCWERYASNSAAVDYYTGGASRDGASGPLRFEEVLKLAGSGDTRAVETLERMARYLGAGLATIVTGLAPQVIVVIGEVTSAWHIVGPIVADVIATRAPKETPTRILPTDHTTQPRLRGAVTLVVQQHFGVPNVA